MSERNSKDRSNLDGPISVGILRLELLHAADACEAVMRGELGTKEFLEDLQSLARCLTEARGQWDGEVRAVWVTSESGLRLRQLKPEGSCGDKREPKVRCRHRNQWGLSGEGAGGDAELHQPGAHELKVVSWCADCGAVAVGPLFGRLRWLKPKGSSRARAK